MARAYSQDLRERVIEKALGGLSIRQAATYYGVGISTAILWMRRARDAGKRAARRQGQPKGSKLDAQADFLLEMIDATSCQRALKPPHLWAFNFPYLMGGAVSGDQPVG
jgi:transposase